MAIDDNINYTLTGAQVKDLAARIKAGGGGMTVYVDESFASPSSITSVFSDSALTTPADPEDMASAISAGGTVGVVYDGGQAQEYIELSSVNSNNRIPEVGKTFTSTISTHAVFSAPTVVTLLYDGVSDSWSAESTPVPTQFSDLSGTVGADQIDNRLFRMLIPEGPAIAENVDLNTIDYLSVGKYYCQGNSTVATLSNCPTTNAFMMEVFSPISTTIDDETTAPWCYRLRLITDYTGKMYMQRANTGGTAGVWTYFDWVAVNPDTSVSSYSVTSQAAHSGGTNNYVLKKQLDRVSFAANIAWVNSVTADSWTLLGVIPSAVRPSVAHYCSGVAVKSNGSLLGYCRIEIETNGNVNFKCSAGNAGLSGIGFNLSWFV